MDMGTLGGPGAPGMPGDDMNKEAEANPEREKQLEALRVLVSGIMGAIREGDEERHQEKVVRYSGMVLDAAQQKGLAIPEGVDINEMPIDEKRLLMIVTGDYKNQKLESVEQASAMIRDVVENQKYNIHIDPSSERVMQLARAVAISPLIDIVITEGFNFDATPVVENIKTEIPDAVAGIIMLRKEEESDVIPADVLLQAIDDSGIEVPLIWQKCSDEVKAQILEAVREYAEMDEEIELIEDEESGPSIKIIRE